LAQTKEPSEAFLELARFNAAVLLFLTGRVDSIEEGLLSLSSS
jgi:anthranilate phosphoribosyltransferase